MAAAGEQCQFPDILRAVPLSSTIGCPDWGPNSDGVVCKLSALYGVSDNWHGYFNDGPKPFVPWYDTTNVYVHTNALWGWGSAGLLCGNSGDPNQNPPMYNPPTYRTLFPQIKAVISAH